MLIEARENASNNVTTNVTTFKDYTKTRSMFGNCSYSETDSCEATKEFLYKEMYDLSIANNEDDKQLRNILKKKVKDQYRNVPTNHYL